MIRRPALTVERPLRPRFLSIPAAALALLIVACDGAPDDDPAD